MHKLDEQDLCPLMVNLDWCDILRTVYGNLTLKDVKDLTGIVTVTKDKAKTKGCRGSALEKGIRADLITAPEGTRKSTRSRHQQIWFTREATGELLRQAKFGVDVSQALPAKERGSTTYHCTESNVEYGEHEGPQRRSHIQYK